MILFSENVVFLVLLFNWMKLLELLNVFCGFVFFLVKVCDFYCIEGLSGVLFKVMSFRYGFIFLFCVNVLEEMLRNGIEVNILYDKERLDIFFDYFNYFCFFFDMMVILLKLLVVKSVKNDVLREVFCNFFCIVGGDFL